MKKPDNNIKDFAKTPIQRLDVFLSTELKVTRSQAQKMIERGEVLVNNEPPFKTGQKIGAKDKVTFKEFVPQKKNDKEKNKLGKNPAFATSSAEASAVKKATAGEEKKFTFKDLAIVKKTPDYFIVEKPTGMLTHSTLKNESDSLAELMLKKFPEIKKVGDDPVRPGIVHRLDKEASGLLVVARTEKMFEHLKKQFKKHTIQKEYLVLVHDKVAKDWGEINFRIDRSETSDRMAARPVLEKGMQSEIGKEALTEFWVEKRFVNFTLLRIKIHTGRMHQIRAHMLAYDHPVVGDPLYFQKKQKRVWDNRLGRLFLHCNKIAFEDLSGQTIRAESPLPEPLENFLKTLS